MNEPSAGGLPSVFEDGDTYDLMVAGIPYGLDFYVALAREANGPVLDIACGTGRILLPCLQAGVDIEGLDLFEPMLKTLRAKAAALGLSPRLHQADMCDFSLPRRYSLIMIPFNAFIHNMTVTNNARPQPPRRAELSDRAAGPRARVDVCGAKRAAVCC